MSMVPIRSWPYLRKTPILHATGCAAVAAAVKLAHRRVEQRLDE